MDKAERDRIRRNLKVVCGYCEYLGDTDCDGGYCRNDESPHSDEARDTEAEPCEHFECSGVYDDMVFEAATDWLPDALAALDAADAALARERLVSRILAGLASTLPEWANRHPEDVLQMAESEADKEVHHEQATEDGDPSHAVELQPGAEPDDRAAV